jgi:hypothetical protein
LILEQLYVRKPFVKSLIKILYKWFFIFFTMIVSQGKVRAQFEKNPYLITGKVMPNGDTIPYITLPTFEVYGGKVDADVLENAKKYERLKRNIIKVLPYARFAAAKFKEINEVTAKMDKKSDKKRFIKDEERKAKEQFENELKNLTYTQGRLLIKLVDRETGHTGYELVKELRGSLHAFFWQSLARMFGSSLKAEYDSTKEDKAIEEIVRGIDAGRIK